MATKVNIKKAHERGYSAGYNAGISQTNCICKHLSPIEDYTVIRKEMLNFLLEEASEPGNINDFK